MTFDKKLGFDSFGFDNVILNNNKGPDENILNNLSQIDFLFCAIEEAVTSLKKFNDIAFSVLQSSVRSPSQNIE